ncbi:MAG: class II fructose-bisphosphate aldolase [Candidatus Aminicenantes bacterium]|nr:class II fructose-bisphosphate aldolase [Candidatus Aminicenantes bacterium]
MALIYRNREDLLADSGIQVGESHLKINNLEYFKEVVVNNLVETLVNSDSIPLRDLCYRVVKTAAEEFGVFPSSIQALYEARAKDGWTHFTVPAMNLRTLTYDSARAVFRSAKKINAGAFIFEIARSEISYTKQRPQEYSSQVILAAIKEGFAGPIFLQGDHFQVDAKKYRQDKEIEIKQLKDLISEAIEAGFYNIDIDSSTLVDLFELSIPDQQALNSDVCADLTKFIREQQPEGLEISIGGEIGEVGKKNSTLEELHAFMQGYLSKIDGLTPISKISVQTGTSHGGVVNPDGSIAEVKIDFDTLKALSQMARTEFGLAGAVQHGASTLPNDSFSLFLKYECAEIHLATEFQNIIYEFFPMSLITDIQAWLHTYCSAEKTPEMSESQFIYKTRKKALGPFKKEIYSLPDEIKENIFLALEKEVLFLFEQLNIKETRGLVGKYIKTD